MLASVRAGCCGFAVARSTYFLRLPAVEIATTARRLPRLETVRRWKQEAPSEFEFALRVPHAVTHPPQRTGRPSRQGPPGLFRGNETVARAWRAFEEVAKALDATLAVFDTPPSFYPHPDYIRDMYKFFKGIRRGNTTMVWAPMGGGWERGVKQRIAKDLGLVLALNEKMDIPPKGPVYYRVRGRMEGRHIDRGVRFAEGEIRELADRFRERRSWVFFENHAMWQDARAFFAVANNLPPGVVL